MSFKIPSPAALKEEKTSHIQMLLNAQSYLPPLVDQLSRGVMSFDEPTAWRWAGWIEALIKSPGWSIIAPALSTPGAWPEVWALAKEAGFSERAAHYNALFFQELFEQALLKGRQEVARSAWRQALLSWSALQESSYLQNHVLGHLVHELTADELAEVLGVLFDHPILALQERILDGLRLSPWKKSPHRRPILFAMEAYFVAAEIVGPSESSFARGVAKRLQAAQSQLERAVVDAFEAELSAIDLTQVSTAQVEELFDGLNARADLLEHPPELDRFILRQGLALIWDLRELGRDEELYIIDALAPRLQPAAQRLRQSDEQTRFGIEGAIADLSVFVGEEALSIDARQAAFEEALMICPGHRNASRMLSYLLLERANRQLLKTSALPAATARIGLLRRQVRPILSQARRDIERAQELFPDNDLLSRYQGDLDEEWQRFRLDQESGDED